MATPLKGFNKSKFLSEDFEDFIEEAIKEPSKIIKKSVKRKPVENIEDDIPQSAKKYQASAKKKKSELNGECTKEIRGKVIDVMEHQIEVRKQGNENLLKSLSEVISQTKADCHALHTNQQKLQNLTAALLKCMEQATAAQKQKLDALSEIQAAFKKQVEGLITRGGMKADDRPLWFDVYKAFPPITEPKLARPKPEAKPIRQILYKEDAVRAKFHSKGHGYGAVNMLSPTGETHTKKLLQQYEKLKAEGVPEDAIIEKSVEAVGIERQQARQEIPAITSTIDPKSVTAQVLNDANLKDIFKDEK